MTQAGANPKGPKEPRSSLIFGIRTKTPADYRSAPMEDFLREVSRRFPSVNSTKEGRDGDSFMLYEAGADQHVREVRIAELGVFVAGGSQLPESERDRFVREVAEAADALPIRRLDIETIDLQRVFSVPHEGNHFDLIASVVTGGSPIEDLHKTTGFPNARLDILWGTHAHGENGLTFIMKTVARTTWDEITSGEFDGDEIDIVCGIGRTSGFLTLDSYLSAIDEIQAFWSEHFETPIVDGIVRPLLLGSSTSD